MSIFEPRTNFKPFEYPELVGYKNAINHSYWLVSEWNFTSDINDYHTKLNHVERHVIKNALLAISQIEVSVKKFWTKLGETFPKAEFDQVGVTFGESEIRHADAYSHLLQVLGLNDDFATLLDNPVIKGRVEYLSKYLTRGATQQEFVFTLALFSLFVENVSLFSQFAVIKSFNKHKNVLKDIDNVVQATQKEELIHAQFGSYLVRLIQKEHPEWFTPQFYERLNEAVVKAFDAECAILDWIFEKGEPEFLTKASLVAFLKQRFNDSLVMIGAEPYFSVTRDDLNGLTWFDDEIHAEVNVDFFHKKPVSYSKKTQAIKAEDIF